MFAASLAALGILVAALVVAIALGFERERLRAFLEVALERAFDTEVSIGALEGRLLPGLALRELRIGPAEAPSLEVERASWRIRRISFSQRQLDIARLRLVGLRVHLDTRRANALRAATAAPTPEETPGMRLSVRGLVLEDARLDWIWSDACDGPCRALVRGRAAAKRLTWPLSREALGALSAELEADFEGVSAGQEISQPLPFEGRIEARLEEQVLRIPALELRAARRVVALEREARIAVEPDHLEIEDLRLRSAAATLGLRGGLGADRFEGLSLEARGIDAAQLAQLASVPIAPAGRIDADVTLDGPFSSPLVRGDLRWEEAQLDEARFGRVLATWNAAPPQAQLALRVMREQRQIATVDAALPYAAALAGDFWSSPEATATLRAESLDVGILAPLLPQRFRSLRGSVRADLAWHGGAPPSLAGWVDLEGGRVALPRIGDALAPFRARAAFASATDGIQVDSFRLDTAVGSAEGRGLIEASALRGVKLRLSGVAVAPLAERLFGLPELGGEARAELALDGPLAQLSASGVASWSDARIGGVQAEQIVLDLALDGARMRGEARIRQTGRETLRVRAALARPAPLALAPLLGPSAEIEVHADRLDLAPWLALLPASALPPGLAGAGGSVRADLVWRGGADSTLTGRFEIEDGRVVLPGLADALAPFGARATLVAEPGGFAAESFALETPIGRATGEGALDRRSLRGVRVRLEVIDVGSLATRLGVAPEVAGEAEADLALDGPIGRPIVRGQIGWSRPRVATARAERAVLEFAADAERVRGTARVQQVDRDVLKLRADLPRPGDASGATWLGPGASVDLDGEAFDLAALTPLLPRQFRDLRGRADLRLHLAGGAQAPQLDGELRVDAGAVSVPLLGQTFAPIEGRVRLVSRRLLPELEIGPPGATAVLSGAIELEGLHPSAGELELALTRFALARSRLLSLDVTGNLRLTGPLRALALVGALRLERAQVRVPEPEDPVLREIRIAVRGSDARGLVEGAPPVPGVLDLARMDLDLQLPRNSWIRGRGIELELEGDLDLLKDPLGPVRYAGTVGTVRGRYTFLGKRFEVRSGSATFEGTDQLDPLLDVEAVHRVRDVDILAYITGHFSNPDLRLSSDPEYEESDVLALLLVGRRADELNERTGNFEAAATKLAAGIAANELSALLRDYTPLDTLDVQIGEGGVPEEIGVGKYVWQDLFVRYGRTFGVDPKDKIGIEYRINENWSVESEMVTDQSAGADLVWGIDY